VKASVIVLNHNGGALLERCIAALVDQDYPDYELVLIDNASSDGSTERVRERFGAAERLRIVSSATNRGCAGGRNVGMREARGDVFCFVDGDAVADRGWLRGLVTALAPPGVGVAASRLVLGWNELLLNGLGGGVNEQGYGFDLGFGEPVDYTDLPSTALFASGNGLGVKREVVDRVGGFDPAYFNYYEDVDLCLRARRAGYEIALSTGAALRHYLGLAGVDGRKEWLCERNRLRTVLKHHPLRRLLPWLVREWRHERDGVRRRRTRPGLFLRAWAWNLWRLAPLVCWRLTSRLPPLDLAAVLTPGWGHAPFKSYNLEIRPDRRGWGSGVTPGADDEGRLLYGWHYGEATPEGIPFRWTT
jgi:GT2 family glycosyltransferase